MVIRHGQFSMYILNCVLQCVAVCCSVLQCVAVCCSVFAACYGSMIMRHGQFSMYIINCVLQCVAVCCSVLQCVAVCCSVFVTVLWSWYMVNLVCIVNLRDFARVERICALKLYCNTNMYCCNTNMYCRRASILSSPWKNLSKFWERQYTYILRSPALHQFSKVVSLSILKSCFFRLLVVFN